MGRIEEILEELGLTPMEMVKMSVCGHEECLLSITYKVKYQFRHLDWPAKFHIALDLMESIHPDTWSWWIEDLISSFHMRHLSQDDLKRR